MSFLKSTVIVSICTLLSRIFGFFRDICFAKYLGTGYLADLFLTAFKLPNFFRNIFTEGAFNSSFIPIFSSELEKNNKKNTDDFARNIFSILLYTILIITLLSEIFMPQLVKILAPGFLDEKNTIIISLTRITFIYLIFISLVSFMSAVLNSYGKFASPAITPVILNMTLIFFSIISQYINKNIAFVLSIGVVIGGLLQFLWLMFFTLKNKLILYPTYPKIDENIKKFLKNFFNGFLGYGVIQINSMIDAIMATHIVGAVSFIYYSDRVSQLPLALIGTAISISLLPLLSKKIHQNNIEEVNYIQEKSIFIGLFLGTPCAIGLYTLADLFIPLLFERGKFVHSDSLAVISCLKLYAFSLPIFILIKILQTIFYANKDTKTPLISSIINLFFNIVLNIVLMKYLSYKGIVLSTVISSYINCLILFIILLKKKKLSFSLDFILKSLKTIYPLLFMIISITLLKNILLINDCFILNLLKLFAIARMSGIIYKGLAFILKIIDKNFLID